jgi:hypothetical protein
MRAYIESLSLFWPHTFIDYLLTVVLPTRNHPVLKVGRFDSHMPLHQMPMGQRSWNHSLLAKLINPEHLEERQGCSSVSIIAAMQKHG